VNLWLIYGNETVRGRLRGVRQKNLNVAVKKQSGMNFTARAEPTLGWLHLFARERTGQMHNENDFSFDTQPGVC
jgi:hypothetical protein